MRVILVGANGTIGKYIHQALRAEHEVIAVGRTSGDYQLAIEDAAQVAAFYKTLGGFDAVVSAAGEVAFVGLEAIAAKDWSRSLGSKLLGQINLVQQALPYISSGGSFTLTTGVLAKEPIRSGTIATTINCALHGYVRAAACEMPRGLRINAVSPTVLADSVGAYGPFFPGFIPVAGERVAQAYKKALMGVQTGQVFEVDG